MSCVLVNMSKKIEKRSIFIRPILHIHYLPDRVEKAWNLAECILFWQFRIYQSYFFFLIKSGEVYWYLSTIGIYRYFYLPFSNKITDWLWFSFSHLKKNSKHMSRKASLPCHNRRPQNTASFSSLTWKLSPMSSSTLPSYFRSSFKPWATSCESQTNW